MPQKTFEEAKAERASIKRQSSLDNLAAADDYADDGIKIAKAEIERLEALKVKIAETGNSDDIDEALVERLYKESRDITFPIDSKRIRRGN